MPTLNAHDNFTAIELLPAVRRTASANGGGVDMRDYVGKVKVILASSAGGGVDHTLDVKLQDSPDNSTFTDITGAVFTQITNAADLTEDLGINIDGAARYIRAVVTIAGTSPVFDCVVLGVGRKQTV